MLMATSSMKLFSRRLLDSQRKIARSYTLSPNYMSTTTYFNDANTTPIENEVSNTQQLSQSERDRHYMQLALRHAQNAFRSKEVPIGAVIVDNATGKVLATSRNKVEELRDITAHAEIDCIKKASALKQNWRLINCTLYSTLEPCPMCLGAIQLSRITRLVYGASDNRLGACGSYIDMQDHPYHSIEIEGGIKAEECANLLKRFFQLRRQEGREDEDGRESANRENDSIFRGSNHDVVTES